MTLWSYRVLDLVPGKDVRGNAGPSGSLDNLIFFIYIFYSLSTHCFLFSVLIPF